MTLKNTKTAENLMRAFAGESQARNRYTLAASAAKQQRLAFVAEVFSYTAGQEKEHAEIFWTFLQEAGIDNVVITDAGYPVDVSNETVALLRAAAHNEDEEASDAYPSFADTAEEEGFPQIATAFRQIAAIEATHGERFEKLAQLLENKRLFDEGESIAWVCLNCGHIHEGPTAPTACPVCHHEQGYFVRAAYAPYSKG